MKWVTLVVEEVVGSRVAEAPRINIMPYWPIIRVRSVQIDDTLDNFVLCNGLSCVRPFKNHTNFQADIISSFLSTVPAGFPLSPGAALAELTGLAPLSPGLGHNPSYHFSMSPRHQVAHS